MDKVFKKYMAVGARVRAVRTNPMLKAEVGDVGTVAAPAPWPTAWWVRFDDGHEEAVAALWVEVLESPKTQEMDLTPLPAFPPRPEPLRPGRRYCLRDALPELRQWLRDIEEGKWPERAVKFLDEPLPRQIQTLATRLPASDRVLASRQAAVLRRMIDETEAVMAELPWSGEGWA